MPYRQAGLLVSESFGGIATDVWTHLAYVRDGGSAVFYVNGALTGSPLTIPLETPTGLPFYIGGENGALPSEFFEGGIDDVRIYDIALTQAQIQDGMEPSPKRVGIPEASTLSLLIGALSLSLVISKRRH